MVHFKKYKTEKAVAQPTSLSAIESHLLDVI